MADGNLDFDALVGFLKRMPAVQTNETSSSGIGRGSSENSWWVKFAIDIEHPLAWHVVQELGQVLNYLSLEKRLPTQFKPVSPPPYMNGGPGEFLSWVIECDAHAMSPDTAAKWLEGRLPKPIEDESEWLGDDDED